MESDVIAWRLAWKLYEATKSDKPEINDGDFGNIYVVNDSGNPVKFYGTNQLKIYNARDAE